MTPTQLKLFKFDGAGNDFVGIEDLKGSIPTGEAAAPLVRALCDRRRGVGGDGVLVLSPPEQEDTHFRMRYYNADGSLGEMCGNGARCIVRFARILGLIRDEASFTTDAGHYHATMDGDEIRIQFPVISTLPRPLTLNAAGESWEADFIEVGVPHLVVWVTQPSRVDVDRVGRELRHHPALAPRGANVNFATRALSAGGTLKLRTYERGVEAETLACGTGSVATAICFSERFKPGIAEPFRLVTTGGDILSAQFTPTGDGFRDVWLGGPARLVFTTTMSWEPESQQIAPYSFELNLAGK